MNPKEFTATSTPPAVSDYHAVDNLFDLDFHELDATAYKSQVVAGQPVVLIVDTKALRKLKSVRVYYYPGDIR